MKLFSRRSKFLIFSKEFWIFLKTVVLTVFKKFRAENFTYRASALTYTTLLSLVPLITVVVIIISLFTSLAGTTDKLQDFLMQNFVPAMHHKIQDYLLEFASKSKQLSYIGIAMLFVTSSMLFMTIENSLNTIWKVPKDRSLHWAFLRYLTILIAGPIFLTLSLSITSFVLTHPYFTQATSFLGGVGKNLFASLFPFFFSCCGLTFLYIVVPNCKVKWRYGLTGGIIAAALFEMFKVGFALYIKKFAIYQVIYGAFAVVPIFLLWLYVSWLIVLLGAAVAYTVCVIKEEN